MSSKSVLQECQVRVSQRSVKQECPVRVSYKMSSKKCQVRVSFTKSVSSKSVLQECQVRVSSKKGVLQECHLSVSRQGVPQVGSLENLISIVSVLQHTCRHSGSWASSCFNTSMVLVGLNEKSTWYQVALGSTWKLKIGQLSLFRVSIEPQSIDKWGLERCF